MAKAFAGIALRLLLSRKRLFKFESPSKIFFSMKLMLFLDSSNVPKLLTSLKMPEGTEDIWFWCKSR